MTIEKFPHLLHGGDYNPDQWLRYPDILEQDIALMKKAGINCVSLAIFAWASLEPEEGKYNFRWLEDIINRLCEEGIYTILATPSAAMPRWLTKKHPEVMTVSSMRVRNIPGCRHNFCPTSPVMREKIQDLDSRLAQKFANHPGVILWHISNELGGNNTSGECHCPLCQEAFRNWLKNKYKTLDALNEAWWADFWSHTYTSWEQIESPAPNGDMEIHGLNLDWKRFCSDQMADFVKGEIDAVNQYGNIPVTVNMMTFYKNLDYSKFAKIVDVISWDSYPSWHEEETEFKQATETAFMHDLMRSFKKAPFLLMESTPSITNWKRINTQKRPGMHMLASLQAIAHGSNSVQYFQIRKGRGSSEKFHGAVIGHDSTENTRTFREVSEVGKVLNKISDRIYETVNKADVALIFDWENWWAVEDARGPINSMRYVDTVLSHYRPFWKMAITTDIVSMDSDLSGYKIVIAPLAYMMKKDFAAQIRKFVRDGGVFVTTYWSGMADENDLCFMGGFPGLISDILGIEEEEIDAVTSCRKNTVFYKGKSYNVGALRDVIHLSGAESIGEYESDYYCGKPAVTVNSYGKGKAYYICSENEDAFLDDFYRDLVKEAGINSNWKGELPFAVTVSKRQGAEDFLFLQNFNEYAVSINLPRDYRTIEGETLSGTLTLNPFQCVILTDN